MPFRLILMLVPTAALAAIFVWCAWQAVRGPRPDRPMVEYFALAVLFAPLGWQAIVWLRADHAAESVVRFAAVWVQMISALGIAAVMFLFTCQRFVAKSRS